MTLFLALSTLYLAGLLTVASETFTHLISESSWSRVLRGFLAESVVFTLTAVAWGGSVWLLLRVQGHPIALTRLITVLGFAHLPLMAYPLTIAPSIGYRLEQLLRLSVYLLFTVAVAFDAKTSLLHSSALCAGGWLLHFLAVERRVLSRGEAAK